MANNKNKESTEDKTPTPPVETTNDAGSKPDTNDPDAAKKAAMEALKKKSEAAKDKANADAAAENLNRMSLFDSTAASGWKTTGTHSLGTMKTEAKSIIVTGKNIGAEQREPDWTTEQTNAIERAKNTDLVVRDVNNTRRSVMDPDMQFVGQDENGSIVPTEQAYVSSLSPERYCIGIGPYKYDVTGSPRYYSDVVVADINGTWLVNQWTSEGIVLEGVASNVLMQNNRAGNTSGRRIGYHFARVGLPAYAFGPLFNTLAKKYVGSMSQVTVTKGYYWMNASWGVSNFAATFSYLDDNSNLKSVTNLSDVMRMLDGKSSMCLGTIAISITCPARMVDGKPTPDTSSYGLSIKMHNAFSIDKVDYHGPPQQGSTGMLIPRRIAEKAKALRSVTGSSTGTVGGIFSTQTSSIFGTGSTAAPTTKANESKAYM